MVWNQAYSVLFFLISEMDSPEADWNSILCKAFQKHLEWTEIIGKNEKKNYSLEKERTGFKIITGKYPAVT